MYILKYKIKEEEFYDLENVKKFDEYLQQHPIGFLPDLNFYNYTLNVNECINNYVKDKIKKEIGSDDIVINVFKLFEEKLTILQKENNIGDYICISIAKINEKEKYINFVTLNIKIICTSYLLFLKKNMIMVDLSVGKLLNCGYCL